MSGPGRHTIHKEHIHHGWNNAFPPRLKIAPGETVHFETVDASSGQLTRTSTAADLEKLDLARVNPVTGPVFVEGARFFVGDPHFAQGDGEICGTAIEASLDVRLRLSVERGVTIPSPLLETATHWFTHGFGEDLDGAMRMAAELAVQFLVERGGYTPDEAYSLASVAVDVGVTQVVDATLGCHAAIPKTLI